jgi:hypothetical protein
MITISEIAGSIPASVTATRPRLQQMAPVTARKVISNQRKEEEVTSF